MVDGMPSGRPLASSVVSVPSVANRYPGCPAPQTTSVWVRGSIRASNSVTNPSVASRQRKAFKRWRISLISDETPASARRYAHVSTATSTGRRRAHWHRPRRAPGCHRAKSGSRRSHRWSRRPTATARRCRVPAVAASPGQNAPLDLAGQPQLGIAHRQRVLRLQARLPLGDRAQADLVFPQRQPRPGGGGRPAAGRSVFPNRSRTGRATTTGYGRPH